MLDALFSWTTLWWLMLILYIPASLGLIFIVLLQKGKGMGFAGAFGLGGGAEAVFGPRSSRTLPARITYTMAGIFMVFSLLLSLISGKAGRSTAPQLVDEATATEAASTSLDAFFNPDKASAAPADEGTVVSTPITVGGGDAGAAGETVSIPITVGGGDAAAAGETVSMPITVGGGDAAAAGATPPSETPAPDAEAAPAAAEAPAAEPAAPAESPAVNIPAAEEPAPQQ